MTREGAHLEMQDVSCRSKEESSSAAKDAWGRFRRSTLSYTAQEMVTNPLSPPEHSMTTVVEDVRRVMREKSERDLLRTLRYSGRGCSGACAMIRDEWHSLGDFFLRLLCRERGKYVPWWIMLNAISQTAVFFFMAAEWGYESGDFSHLPPGPARFFHYIKPFTAETTLDGEYLILWGARDMHEIVVHGEWHRWFSSAVLHASIRHLTGNMLAMLAFGVGLERTYGWVATSVVGVASAIGGNLLSGAFEHPCLVLVGASGSVFGYIGLYLADIVFRWRRLKRPLLRISVMLIILAIVLVQMSSEKHVSHMAHVGGFATGLCASIVVLADELRTPRCRSAARWVAGMLMVLMVVVCPGYVYYGLRDTIEMCEEG